MTDEPTDKWLTVPEAAVAWGKTEQAIRSRIQRKTVRVLRGNDGVIRVCIGESPMNHRLMKSDEPPMNHTPSDQPLKQSGKATIPVDALQVILQEISKKDDEHREHLKRVVSEYEARIHTLKQEHKEDISKLVDVCSSDKASYTKVVSSLRETVKQLANKNARLSVELQRSKATSQQANQHSGASADNGWLSRFFGLSRKSLLRRP